MKRPVLVASIAVAVLVAFVSLRSMSTSRSAQKPIQVEIANTYFKGPPGSLEGMVADADLVVTGRVLDVNARNQADGIHVLTAHRVQIDEVLHVKGGLAVPSNELVFVRNGGDIDLGTHVRRIVEDDFPAIQPGHRYVLFLSWNTALEAWKPAFGPDSVLDITSGKVFSHGKAKVTDSVRGTDATALIEALKRAGGRRGR